MMAHGHATVTLAAGLAIGDSLSLPPVTTIALALAGAGAALLPDIDCAGSTAATTFGPFSQLAHHGAIQLHHMVYSSMYPDLPERGAHRMLTHWHPFWIVCGLGVEIGCLASKWAAMGVLAVLFALAARGLTIPDLPAETQGRFDDSFRHHAMMRLAYGLLNLNPFTLCMRRARKHVAKSRRYGWWIFTVRFGVGKVATAAGALGLAWYLTTDGVVSLLAPWLGLIVGAGMLLHWVEDAPTHMGVPGFKLHQVWKLPFWASFYAGGVFEAIVVWFAVGWLNILLVPGLLSHPHQMTLLFWVSIVLGALIALAILIEGTSQVNRRRYAT